MQKTKRLLPAQHYLEVFKECSPTISKYIFFEILKHIAEWEAMEIRMAILSSKTEGLSESQYLIKNYEKL